MRHRGALLMLAACSGLLLGAARFAHAPSLATVAAVLGVVGLSACMVPVGRRLLSLAASCIIAARRGNGPATTRPDAVSRGSGARHTRITDEPEHLSESFTERGTRGVDR